MWLVAKNKLAIVLDNVDLIAINSKTDFIRALELLSTLKYIFIFFSVCLKILECAMLDRKNGNLREKHLQLCLTFQKTSCGPLFYFVCKQNLFILQTFFICPKLMFQRLIIKPTHPFLAHISAKQFASMKYWINSPPGVNVSGTFF